MYRMLVNLCRLAVVALIIGNLLTIAACGHSDEERVMAQEIKKPLGVGSAEKANAALEKAVKEKLAGDRQLKEAKIVVTGDVTRNEVTLSGTVPSEALRAKAAELAKSAQAGVMVNNKIILQAKTSKPVPSARKTSHG
jgi:osmotically-inducible protein OsmY